MLHSAYTVKITSIGIVGLALTYFLLLGSQNLTFFNMGEDGPLFVQTAKFLSTGAPSPGSPLFHLTNAGWLRVFDFGTDYGTLVILPSLYSAITAGLLYLITRNLLAPLLWLSSGVVLSQSTILELYTLVTLSMVLAYYCHTKNHRLLAYFIIGLGITVHHTAGMGLLALIVTDFVNKNSIKPALVTLIPLILIIYVPLTNREPYYMISGHSTSDYLKYFFSTASGLLGGLALYPTDDLVGRIWDVSRILLGGLGLSILLVIVTVKQDWKEHLLPLLMGLLPLIYYSTTSDNYAYFTILPTFAFGAVIASKSDWKFVKNICIGICSILIVMNIFLYDFDRNDPDKTAVQFYNQLETLPDNSVLETCYCISNSIYVNMVYLYNRNSEKNIYVLDTEFYRIPRGMGTDGKPITSESWKQTVQEAEEQNKLWRVKANSFLKGEIVPATSKEVLSNYLTSDFYKETINGNSS